MDYNLSELQLRLRFIHKTLGGHDVRNLQLIPRGLGYIITGEAKFSHLDDTHWISEGNEWLILEHGFFALYDGHMGPGCLDLEINFNQECLSKIQENLNQITHTISGNPVRNLDIFELHPHVAYLITGDRFDPATNEWIVDEVWTIDGVDHYNTENNLRLD